MLEATPWKFKNTDVTFHRATKREQEDTLTIDLLVGHEKKHAQIIQTAITEETEYGYVRISTRDDLIWMKQFRNLKQDIVDIEALENDEDTKSH